MALRNSLQHNAARLTYYADHRQMFYAAIGALPVCVNVPFADILSCASGTLAERTISLDYSETGCSKDST